MDKMPRFGHFLGFDGIEPKRGIATGFGCSLDSSYFFRELISLTDRPVNFDTCSIGRPSLSIASAM